MGLFILGVTVAGFARSYYLNYWFDTPRGMRQADPFIASPRRRLHCLDGLDGDPARPHRQQEAQAPRKLGYAGAAIAATMVVLGISPRSKQSMSASPARAIRTSSMQVPFFGINSSRWRSS
jgi:hypothetical protein